MCRIGSSPHGARSTPRGPAFRGPGDLRAAAAPDEVERCDVAISGCRSTPGSRTGRARVSARGDPRGSGCSGPTTPGSTWSRSACSRSRTRATSRCNPFDIDEAITTIEAGARACSHDAGELVAIGGDHTIALPLLRAMRAKSGQVALVHFDAHLDTWDTYFGAPYTHGTPFRRAAEEGLFGRSGRRTSGSAGRCTRGPTCRRRGVRVHDRVERRLRRRSIDDVAERMRERVGTRPSTSRSTST